ncbi:MltA domain-containing protein, partial [Undibacterium luofuense]|uniref:MltA domain-containing protein n=1 Tax=Undibacterium luofuense TaxID=2828733 RepID=UPI0030EC0DF8
MTPLDLLAAVLPSPGNGYYCAVELTNKKEHVFGQTIEEIMPTVEKWAKAGYDTYFALGTFGTNEDRTKENMHASQVLAVDIDCNHPKDLPSVTDEETGELVVKRKAYPSAKAAALVLQKFCEDTGLSALGDPWLVHSGGGLHAYWPLDQVLFKEDWYPLARRFKELCVQYDLDIDMAVTSDASRVLRIPDTVNTGVKNGKKVREQTQVRFISEGSRFQVDDIDAVLTANGIGKDFVKKPAPSALALPGQRPTSVTSSAAVKLFENSVTKFKKIVIKTRDGTGCGQLAHYIENASDDGMEPLWRGVLSWAKVCEEVRRLGPDWGQRVDDGFVRQWVESHFQPWRVTALDGANSGLLTGYFEPLLDGRRKPDARFAYPLHRAPAGLGQRKPFFTRSELESTPEGRAAIAGREVVWLADPLDVLLIQVQGSGRIRLLDEPTPQGAPKVIRLAFAGHNEQPYMSVARWLVDQGAFTLEQASWPAIRSWAQANPARVGEMMAANPRVVFFREEALPDPELGPKGAQGVPLTPGRSIAVDRDSVPLGTWTHALQAMPLAGTMAMGVGLYFGLHGHPGGLAIYINTLMELPSLPLQLALFIWGGMLFKQSHLVDLFMNLLRPWRLSPEALTFLILMGAAIPTAYTGGSGAFVMAA